VKITCECESAEGIIFALLHSHYSYGQEDTLFRKSKEEISEIYYTADAESSRIKFTSYLLYVLLKILMR